jgi:outer membrane lipoprotein SlyB
MNSKIKYFIASLMVLSLLGCSIQDGTGRYRVASIGNAQRSIEAVVISAESVLIQSITNGAGGTAGGLLGTAAAAESSDNSVVIIAGMIGGAIVGNAIENAANTHEGMEYVIQTGTGALLTVAQVNEGNSIFTAGNKVILVYGYPNRLIKDPR